MEKAALTGGYDRCRKLLRDAMHIPLSEDAVTREFTLMGARAAIFYVDGLSSGLMIQEYILLPCLRATGGPPSRDHLLAHLLPVGSVSPTMYLEAALTRIYAGDAALLVEGIDGALIADVKGFVKRGVHPPATETVVLGPQEAFTESLRDNIVLLRRIMRTPDLISEPLSVGDRIPSRVCLLYLQGVAQEENMAELRRRLNGCRVDYISSLGMLEQLLEDAPYALVPQFVTTERPDRAASFLLSGQVLIGLENAPQLMAAPMSLLQLFHAPDDSALRLPYGLFLRVLRLLGVTLSLLTPALFVALTGYHTAGLPLTLLTSVQEAQSQVPIAIFPATFSMLLVFSLINEASTRVPAVMGGSLGVVSALILGQAVAEADLVSPLLIVLVALSGLGSFVLPDYALSMALRIAQLLLVLSAGVGGYFGMVLCLFLFILRLAGQTSLGSPICAPAAPLRPRNPDQILRYPVWRQRLRGYAANPAHMLRTRGPMRAWQKGKKRR